MPRISSECRKTVPAYDALCAAKEALNETRDCSVVAVAAVCGVSYEVAHATLKQLGRKDQKGTTISLICNALRALGFQYESVSRKNVISNYPAGHRDVLKNITTHHPERFNKVWKDGFNYLFFTSGHVLAVLDGTNVGHTKGRAVRVEMIYKVTKSCL